jgi:hypothetical protein
VGREGDKAWVDVVIYHGRKRSIDFRELDCAAFGIALEVTSSRGMGDFPHERDSIEDSFDNLGSVLEDRRLVQRWRSAGKDLTLTIPTKPDKIGQLQKQPVALIDGKAPWELAEPSLLI